MCIIIPRKPFCSRRSKSSRKMLRSKRSRYAGRNLRHYVKRCTMCRNINYVRIVYYTTNSNHELEDAVGRLRWGGPMTKSGLYKNCPQSRFSRGASPTMNCLLRLGLHRMQRNNVSVSIFHSCFEQIEPTKFKRRCMKRMFLPCRWTELRPERTKETV